MRLFLKKVVLFFVFVLFAQGLYGDEVGELKGRFLNKIDEVVLIVKDKSLTKSDRNSNIVNTITPMFDFELMAKLSLGDAWKQLSKEEQDKFIKLYVERMKQSYSSKLDAYKDEKVQINNIEKLPNNRLSFDTDLVNKKEKLDIIYKFHKPKERKNSKDEWLIYDVEILGVSILKTDKAQFKEFLRTKKITELMEVLAKKS